LPSESHLERLKALVLRELGAADVLVLSPGEPAPHAENVLVSVMPDQRTLVVSFGEPVAERDALERRLAMLVDSFAEVLAEERPSRGRVPVATSLRDELRALAVRAQAREVVVIDVDSPVLWASAYGVAAPRPAESEPGLVEMSRPQLSGNDGATESTPPPGSVAEGDRTDSSQDVASQDTADAPMDPRDLARAGVRLVRAIPGLAQQARKGRHVRHAEQGGEVGYLAITFSGIYVLVLVFGGQFDELRAERAATDALPRIGRLVLALPPLDPDPQPMGDVVALRKRRR
jgi:hypothetical protein